jgi:hypothetical protein
MDNRRLQRFKRYLEQAANALRVPYRQFIQAVSLGDFLVDQGDENEVIVIVTRAFAQLCDNDVPFHTHVVLTAIVHLLDSELGKPVNDPQFRRLRDLWQMSMTPVNESEFRRWVETWYH